MSRRLFQENESQFNRKEFFLKTTNKNIKFRLNLTHRSTGGVLDGDRELP